MKQILKYSVSFLIIIFAFIFFIRVYGNRSYKVKGNKLIDEVENFRKVEGRLPTTANELNFNNKMGEGPYYKKENDSTYIIYFNIGFDNGLEYSSSTREWKEKP